MLSSVKSSPPRGAPAQSPAGSEFPSLAFPPDRTMLYVFEVAKRLRVSKQHVVDLIEEGRLRAINVAGHSRGGRRCYRIPVESWRVYVSENLI